MDGFIFVDKPSGPSSSAVVQKIRRALGGRGQKAGHSGTLDPDATGLLIVGLGNATCLFQYLTLEPKQYQFAVRFGIATDTLDSCGTVTRRDERVPCEQDVRDSAASLCGTIVQTPPRYSALKVNGVPAYKLARQEKSFSLSERTVHIHSLSLDTYDQSKAEASFTVSCSSGTYVRSLCVDIAAKTGAIGHTISIRRTAMGAFRVESAAPLDSVVQQPGRSIVPIEQVVEPGRSYTASDEELQPLMHGHDITINGCAAEQDILFVFDAGKRFRAVVRRVGGGTYHPVRVASGCST